MDSLAAHVLDGTLPEPETRTYALSDAARAYQNLAEEHTRGKLVVVVDPEAAR